MKKNKIITVRVQNTLVALRRIKMFKFIKQTFALTLMFFDSLLNVNLLECVSMNNQECKVRPEIINVNSNKPLFYRFSIKTSTCSGSCKSIIPMQNCVFLMLLKI